MAHNILSKPLISPSSPLARGYSSCSTLNYALLFSSLMVLKNPKPRASCTVCGRAGGDLLLAELEPPLCCSAFSFPRSSNPSPLHRVSRIDHATRSSAPPVFASISYFPTPHSMLFITTQPCSVPKSLRLLKTKHLQFCLSSPLFAP